jgi:hypothetical protein
MPYISDEDARIIREMRDWQRNFNGPASINGPGGAAFGLQQNSRRQRRAWPTGAAKASIGTDVGQVHIMVANNQDGWDYPFAVSTQ